MSRGRTKAGSKRDPENLDRLLSLLLPLTLPNPNLNEGEKLDAEAFWPAFCDVDVFRRSGPDRTWPSTVRRGSPMAAAGRPCRFNQDGPQRLCLSDSSPHLDNRLSDLFRL